MRMTRKDAEAAFERLCKALGKRKATAYNDIGGWNLDYADCYGGFTIEEITNSSGAVKHPLGMGRKSPKEFCECVSFLLDGIYEGVLTPAGGKTRKPH